MDKRDDMDALENNRVRAILTQPKPDMPPELKQRLAPPMIDRANLPSGNVPPEIRQRLAAGNAQQSLDALGRANTTVNTPANTQAPSRIGNFFSRLDDPIVTRQGAASAAQNTVNTAKNVANSVIESPKTATVLKGAARAGGLIQAFNAGNELINGTGNAFQKADSAINLGLGVGTTVNPIVGAPNLAYQGAKVGGGVIASLADKAGLLDGFKPKEQAQTAGFEAAQRKFLESKVASKVTASPTPASTPNNTSTEKPFGFENLSQKEQQAIVRDAQKSGVSTASLKLQGNNGQMNNSTLAVPKAQAANGRRNSNIIQAAFTPQNNKVAQNQAQESQQVQQAPVAQRPQFSPEEMASTPKKVLDSGGQTFDPVSKKVINGASIYEYPDGRRVVLPINAKLDDNVLPGYSRYKQLSDFDAAQQQAQSPAQFTSDGRQINNPVRVIDGTRDFIEGFDATGNPVSGKASQEVAKRNARGEVQLDAQGNTATVSDFAQTPQLTDAEKTQGIKNEGDIATTNIATQGRITEQGISSGATNAAKNQEAGLIAEYFNSKTKPERRALLAPLVTGGGQSSKGFDFIKQIY